MNDLNFLQFLFFKIILPIGGSIGIALFICCCFNYLLQNDLENIRYCSNCGFDLLSRII